MNTTLDFEQAWQAVEQRDAASDGSFVFAVRTTGVYCRPSCAARRPNRDNVSFFADPEAAERAGFRACLRCYPRDDVSPAERLVTAARALLDGGSDEPLGLTDLATVLAVSPGHLQRSFKRLTGVSPRQYAESLRLQRLKASLREGADVATATYDAGFGSSSRVYEKAGAALGMTPGAYRRGGRGMTIGYTIGDSAMGPLLVAATERGLCFVAFARTAEELVQELKDEYPLASMAGEDPSLGETADRIVCYLDGRCRDLNFDIDVQGTEFQLLVWRALRGIPYGETRSYGELAAGLGLPRSARGVARACATNPVSLVVPCHRVISGSGGTSGYRWGIENKRRLLRQERRASGRESAGVKA